MRLRSRRGRDVAPDRRETELELKTGAIMIRFDWRQFEPDEERRPQLINRYNEHMRDPYPWRRLVGRVSELWVSAPSTVERSCLEAFDEFLNDVPDAVIAPPAQCVFISHQRADTSCGKRVACLSDHCGLDCWLDVFDPTLALANQLPQHDPRRSVLIAAIIEIALLSSTHVIALHTTNSLASRWVPYELGRAKARNITSLQAAGWFQKGQTVASCGDYVQL